MDESELYEKYGIIKARVNNDYEDRETPVWITNLQKSVYATAMMSPLWITRNPGFNFETIFGIGLLWLLAYFSFAIQATSIYFVYNMTSEFENINCDNSSYYLQLISLICFTSLIWVDIFETFKLSSYIYLLPTANNIDGKLVENIKFNHTGSSIGFLKNNESGVTKQYRTIVLLLIIIPKYIIACTLWFYGCKFILNSKSNESVLLNSVSLNFLLDIDDYLYNAFISDFVKNTLINDWPSLTLYREELGLSGDNIKASCKNIYGFYSAWSQPILPILIIFLVLIIRYINC